MVFGATFMFDEDKHHEFKSGKNAANIVGVFVFFIGVWYEDFCRLIMWKWRVRSILMPFWTATAEPFTSASRTTKLFGVSDWQRSFQNDRFSSCFRYFSLNGRNMRDLIRREIDIALKAFIPSVDVVLYEVLLLVADSCKISGQIFLLLLTDSLFTSLVQEPVSTRCLCRCSLGEKRSRTNAIAINKS